MSLLPSAESFDAARKAHFAVTLHKPEDFEGMRRAGRLAAEVLDLLVPLVKPGVTTAALDKVAYDYIVSNKLYLRTSLPSIPSPRPARE